VDATAREALAQRFAERFWTVADATADRTGRRMAIEDACAEVATGDDTGALTVTVTWHGLAAVDGERVTLVRPFASEFAPDRRLRVVPPDGYAIADANPAPTRKRGTSSPGRRAVTSRALR
jgi:hypothetical protein